MRMRINVYAVLGSVMGWFIIGYTFAPYTPTLNAMLGRSIIGLIIAIFIGLLFGIYDDLSEANKEHAKLMRHYYKVKREMLKNEKLTKKHK